MEGIKANCFVCGTEFIWGGVFDASEIFGEDSEFEFLSNYTCPYCGAEYEVATRE